MDKNANTVTLPGSDGKTTTAAVEDSSHAIVNDELASCLVESVILLSDSNDDIVSAMDTCDSRSAESDDNSSDAVAHDDEHTTEDATIAPYVGDRLEFY